jgi:hypothetical protein
MKLKYRKNLFLGLMVLAAGGSAAAYNSLDGDLVTKAIQVVVLQQLVGAAIYFGCFGVNQTRSPFE